VVGETETTRPDPTCDPPQVLTFKSVLWEKTRVHKLPAIQGDPDGLVNTINDKSQIGAATVTCNFSSGHPVLWQKRQGNRGGVRTSGERGAGGRAVSGLRGSGRGAWHSQNREMPEVRRA